MPVLRFTSLFLLAATLLAQTPAFEAATVKPSGPANSVIGMFTYPGGRISATNYTLKMLLAEAFNLQMFQISGGPGWINDTRWNIEAKPPADSRSSHANPFSPKLAPNGEQRDMLRSLSIERFQLKFHRQTADGQVYFLRKAGKPPRIQPAKDDRAYPWVGGPHGGAVIGDGLAATNATMALVAERLARYLGRPVIDETGIEGACDFRFDYPMDERPDVVGSILALVRGLGLRLEAGKGSVETIVIDSAQKPGNN